MGCRCWGPFFNVPMDQCIQSMLVTTPLRLKAIVLFKREILLSFIPVDRTQACKRNEQCPAKLFAVRHPLQSHKSTSSPPAPLATPQQPPQTLTTHPNSRNQPFHRVRSLLYAVTRRERTYLLPTPTICRNCPRIILHIRTTQNLPLVIAAAIVTTYFRSEFSKARIIRVECLGAAVVDSC
jgi:hypothetical protein